MRPIGNDSAGETCGPEGVRTAAETGCRAKPAHAPSNATKNIHGTGRENLSSIIACDPPYSLTTASAIGSRRLGNLILWTAFPPAG